MTCDAVFPGDPGAIPARSLAEWDWLIDYHAQEPLELHAPVADALRHFHMDWDGEVWAGDAVCGVSSQRWDIPGLGSRMSRDRCAKCCGLMGYPPGVGSPKNDAECRRRMGAT